MTVSPADASPADLSPADVEAAVGARYGAGAQADEPMIAEGSIDVVVSNCVLNLVLVATEHKATLFDEIHRVLRRGGRAVISDIVSDVEVPETMRADPQLVDCAGAQVELKTTGAMYRSGS